MTCLFLKKPSTASNFLRYWFFLLTNYLNSTFQSYFDQQYLMKKMTLDIPPPAWQKFVRSMLTNFERSASHKLMEFVECIGFQHHTAKGRGGLSKHSAKNNDNSKLDFHYFRWCYGKDLFFRADGSIDPDPIHFWYPWLTEQLKTQPILESLQFKPAVSNSLEALIRAYTPGLKLNLNFYIF